MATIGATVVRLSDLQPDQEAECFAALVRKVGGRTYKNEPFVKCYFRDKRAILEAPLWADSRWLKLSEGWAEGEAFRLHVKATASPKYGMQLEIVNIRPAVADDEADGYDFYDLVESSERTAAEMWRTLHEIIQRCIDDPLVRRLVHAILDANRESFGRMQAAANFHHSYTGGLLEHACSMARIGGYLADHYARYYHALNPPLNRSVIVAAAILHDIGKLRELQYHPVEARYTKEGSLIGHVLMGRDMVREAARAIEGFPEETLLLLEHAILAHHGKREFGAPILPQTIEALIVSYVDDLDAKVNIAARQLLRSDGDGEFTEKLYALDNRRIYRGVPLPPPPLDGEADGVPGPPY